MILFTMRMDWIAFKGILVQGSNSNWNCALDISNYYNYNQTINCLDMDHPSPTPDLFAKLHNLDLNLSFCPFMMIPQYICLPDLKLARCPKKVSSRIWRATLGDEIITLGHPGYQALFGQIWASLGYLGPKSGLPT